jgi:pimeloyl-ACP methyl ester carboxylesterase
MAEISTLRMTISPGVADQARQAVWAVHSIKNLTGASRLILVGHSMGGLAARAYVIRYAKHDVRAIVALGTPHAGSILALAADKTHPSLAPLFRVIGRDPRSPALADLKPDSSALKELNEAKLPREIHYVDVISQFDRDAWTDRWFHDGLEWGADKLDLFRQSERRGGLKECPEECLRECSDGVVPVGGGPLFSSVHAGHSPSRNSPDRRDPRGP